MGQSVQVAGVTAIIPTLNSKSETGELLASGNDEEWFAPVAWDALGKEAGLHLHYITGWPLSSCYAFVAKDADKRRKLHPQFLRILIHAAQGEAFFRAFMAGCTAQWWIDFVRAAAIGAQVLEITKRE